MALAAPDDGGPPPRGLKRYWKWLVGLLMATGALGAITTNAIDDLWPGATEKLSGDRPVRINVRENPQAASDGFTLAMASPEDLRQKLGRAGDCDSLYGAAKATGAADVRKAIYHLVLEGRTHRGVAITDMRARVLKRDSPLRGARVSCASAGAQDAIGVAFDLDERTPVARKLTAGDKPGKPYFGSGNVVTLDKTEIQPFGITARVTRDYVEWEIEARLVIDGKAREITIDKDGQPFRITGARALRDYAQHVEWVWYETPGHLHIGPEPNT